MSHRKEAERLLGQLDYQEIEPTFVALKAIGHAILAQSESPLDDMTVRMEQPAEPAIDDYAARRYREMRSEHDIFRVRQQKALTHLLRRSEMGMASTSVETVRDILEGRAG